MSKCALMQGFFALRPCKGQAIGKCDTCSRAVCARHGGVTGTCLECAGRAEADAWDDDDTTDLSQDMGADEVALHAFRHQTYASGYRPFMSQPGQRGAHYDNYDARAFDADMSGADDALGAAGTDESYLVDS